MPVGGRAAADLTLDPAELSDALADAPECLGGDRRGTSLDELAEAPTDVRPEGEVYGATLGQDLVARLAIHLQHAGEAAQMAHDVLGLVVGRAEVRDAGRIRPGIPPL